MLAAVVILGAILGRIKGGWLALDPPGSDRNFKARCAWAIPTGILIGSLSANIWYGLAGVLLAWAGGLLPRVSWQSIGEHGITTRQAALGAFYGVVQYGLLILPFGLTHGPEIGFYALLGVMQPVFYVACWKLPAQFGPVVRRGNFATQLVDWHTGWAELMTHGAMWAAILLAALAPLPPVF